MKICNLLKISFVMHKYTVHWGTDIQRRNVTRPKEAEHTKWNAPSKKKPLSLSGIMKYLGKYSLWTTEVCEPLKELTSLKCDWIWNNMYQNIYDGAKIITKKNTTMTFYNENINYIYRYIQLV